MTVAYYVGGPGTGKTTLACLHALTRCAERGVPGILLDSENVVGTDKWNAPVVPDLNALQDAVWRDGRHVRFHTFEPAVVELLALKVRDGGDICLIMDECSYWANSRGCLDGLARAVRVHRHSRVDYFFTSQYPADISPLIWNCRTDVYIFRNEAARAVERLVDELALPRDAEELIRTLPDMRYFHRGRAAE